jgi:hypothetical protein
VIRRQDPSLAGLIFCNRVKNEVELKIEGYSVGFGMFSLNTAICGREYVDMFHPAWHVQNQCLTQFCDALFSTGGA